MEIIENWEDKANLKVDIRERYGDKLWGKKQSGIECPV